MRPVAQYMKPTVGGSMRKNITVRKDVAERMASLPIRLKKQINWSNVASDAFEAIVEELERLPRNDKE